MAGAGPFQLDFPIGDYRRQKLQRRSIGRQPHHIQVSEVIAVIVVRSRRNADGDFARSGWRNVNGRSGIRDVVGRVQCHKDAVCSLHRVAGLTIVADTRARSEKGEAVVPRRVEAGELEAGEKIRSGSKGLGVAEKRIARGLSCEERKALGAVLIDAIESSDHDKPN